MRIYVAGPLAAIEQVQAVQSAVLAAGHTLTLDWSRGPDIDLGEAGYAAAPVTSARLASQDLGAVLEAEAVLVLATEHDGRGMFAELGAALTRVVAGELAHLVLIGEVAHDSVFYHHAGIQRFATVDDWLADQG